MLESFATLSYDPNQDVLRAEIAKDFADYYKFLYLKESWNLNKMWIARYGVHITVYNQKYHGKKQNVEKFDGQIIKFYYNPELIYQGGQTKGFIGFYLQIESPDIDLILETLGIQQKLHVSLFSNKLILANKNKK